MADAGEPAESVDVTVVLSPPCDHPAVSRIPSDPEYTALIGQVAYEVSWLEGLVLFDLPRLGLPDTVLDMTALMAQPTGIIAQGIVDALASVEDPAVYSWLETSGKALAAIAVGRSHVLHARPATTPDGKQRLLRDRTRNGRRDLFWITEEFLRQQLAEVEAWADRIYELRVPLESVLGAQPSAKLGGGRNT